MTKSGKIYTNIYMSRMPCNNGSTHCHGICCVTGAQNNDKER